MGRRSEVESRMTREQLLAALLEDALLHARKRLPKDYPALLSESFSDPLAFTARIREEMDGIKSDTAIREALARYLAREIAPVLSILPEEFFNQSLPERRATLSDKLPAAQSAVGRLSIETLSYGSYQDLTSKLARLARSFVFSPLVVVQSAAPLAKDVRKIDEALSKNYPFSVITFLTVPSLGGGLRIFADGALVDASWLGRLRTILTTIHEQSYVI